MGSDDLANMIAGRCGMFQSTLPYGERLGRDAKMQRRNNVSIHAPTWGSTLTKQRRYTAKVVSIHAPTRGATFRHKDIKVSLVVSIHAPTRGATSCLCHYHPLVMCFNPRSHMGSDGCVVALNTLKSEVSIHAPAWGATVSSRRNLTTT